MNPEMSEKAERFEVAVLSEQPPALNVSALNFAYVDHPVLHQIDLCIEQGRIIGLLGENGAGKTTLLDLIYGFHGSWSEISIFGRNAQSRDEIQSLVSYVPDSPNLPDYLTAEQYLNFLFRIEHIDPASRRNCLLQYLKTFELELDFRDKLIKEYSFGMKKKLQLIGELMLRKPILLIDEPTNGLDIGMVIRLKRCLRELGDSRRHTMLLSSHNAQFIKDVCHEVQFIHNGRLLATIPVARELDLEQTYLELVEERRGN